MGVSLTDLIALAKAGYTPAAVKELIALSDSADPSKTEDPKTKTEDPKTKTEDPKASAKTEEPQGAAAANSEPKTVSPEPEKNKATENASQQSNREQPEPAVDYKSLYEKTADELKKAQSANRSQSAPEDDPAKAMKDLSDVIRSYL